MSIGERDIATLLRAMQPMLDPQPWAFGTLPPGTALPDGLEPLATMREAEGLSIIASTEALAAAGLAHQPGWALITLTIHSSLEAVGLIAAVSAALAAAGISVNPVAGYHHDHLFVPWENRHAAMQAIEALTSDYAR